MLATERKFEKLKKISSYNTSVNSISTPSFFLKEANRWDYGILTKFKF